MSSLTADSFLREKHEQAATEPAHKGTDSGSDEKMGEQMSPGFAVTAERILRHAVNIVGGGEDGNADSHDRDQLRRNLRKSDNRQELFVAAEAAGVHADRKVKD